MKKISILILTFLLCFQLFGCGKEQTADIVATTRPLYEFTVFLCQNTDLTVEQLISQEVSCLHDYTLQVSQMKTIEQADTVIINGAGLESFLYDILLTKETIIDSSEGVTLIDSTCSHEDHEAHHHETDAHIWLSPDIAITMAQNICNGLCDKYPNHEETLKENYLALVQQLHQLKDYGSKQLKHLSCRNLITFHDGFSYFAKSFDLNILAAIEEESGSEASAATLIELSELILNNSTPAIFIEENGSVSAAKILQNETGVNVYTLRMGLSGSSYFETMYYNIDTIKEALE